MINVATMVTRPTNDPASTEAEQTRLKKEVEKERDGRASTSATSELLFVLLPFIVIGVTLAHRDEFRSIFYIPEWSIVSAVIVGQAIVKLASASVGSQNVRKETIILIMAVLLVCFLGPILIILAISLTSASISNHLAITQGVFFLLSAVVFWFASMIENYQKIKNEKDE